MKVRIEQVTQLAGNNIRRERMRQDLSGEQLAERANITSQYLSLLENGNRCASMYVYLKISNALTVPFEMLFMNSKHATATPNKKHTVCKLLSNSTSYEQRIVYAIVSSAITAMRSNE